MRRRAFLAGAAALPVVAAIGPAPLRENPLLPRGYADALIASMAQPSRLAMGAAQVYGWTRVAWVPGEGIVTTAIDPADVYAAEPEPYREPSPSLLALLEAHG